MQKLSFIAAIVLVCSLSVFSQTSPPGTIEAFSASGGALGNFTLKHTDVKVKISGFSARVNVRQEFLNNFSEPTEAVYTFPLSQNGAVDSMTMKIGERTINGRILKRGKAREVYETAKIQGKTAALLDQMRPNVFMQSVANIAPGETVFVEISYVETLKFEDGEYEFVFPLTVAPRYDPAPGTTQFPGTGPTTKIPEMRRGNDVSIEVELDAGTPIESIRSPLHEIETININPSTARIKLKDVSTIPNKDFILRYDVTGKSISDAVLLHQDDRGGFFNLIIAPPQDLSAEDLTPKEIVFVLDTSGSMSGFPIEKAKEAMKLSLDGLNPNDTFNIITFAGQTSVLFEKPVPATPANMLLANNFLLTSKSAGGTEMMKAIKAAFAPSGSKRSIRIVCFMTDGLVANEAEIIAEVQNHKEARVFSFGIGNNVNRFLLDKIASEGRGDVEYVSLNDDGAKAARRFYERVRSPLLTDIEIDWNDLPVSEVYPKRLPDLFGAKPVVISGRYAGILQGQAKIRGNISGQKFERTVEIVPASTENSSLASIWARRKVDELQMSYLRASASEKIALEQQITNVGLEFNLLTQFTSFVAVEGDTVISEGVEIADSRSGSVQSSHGFVSQISAGNRSTGRIDGMAANRPANVVNLELKTPAGGKDVSVTKDGSTTEARSAIVILEDDQPVLKAVLARVESQNKQLRTVRANVTSTIFVADSKTSYVKKGKIIYALDNSRRPLVRFDWTDPATVINSYANREMIEYREATKTAVRISLPDNDKLPQWFWREDSASLAGNYDVKYIGNGKIGETPVWLLELTSKSKTNDDKFEFWVDQTGTVIQVRITLKNGNYHNMLFTDLVKNGEVNSKEFRISLPQGTKITTQN
ncbi:MAG: VWA domain-containing protein [Pyrinomonadaceae bacterium]|nr:VWA domain-containing protein [Pyrinomonadaceae bacterium]